MTSKGTSLIIAASIAAPLLLASPQPLEARPRKNVEKHSKKKFKTRHARRVFSLRIKNPRLYTNIEKGCIVLDPRDRDLIIRTVMGEANSEPYKGKVGVAATVLNRVRDGGFGGNSVQGVLFKPKQFEPWNTRRGELMRYGPQSRGWAEAEAAVDEAASGNDPTGGATHFANVSTVRARGNTSALGWLRGMSGASRIGQHTFGRADGKGDGRVRTIDGGEAPEGLDFDDFDDGPGFDDTDDLLGHAFASLTDETDDPRRLAVRE